jgi:hypothetical protein
MNRRSFLSTLWLASATMPLGRQIHAAEPVASGPPSKAVTRTAPTGRGGTVRLCVPLVPGAAGHRRAAVPVWSGGTGAADLFREPLHGSEMLPAAWSGAADGPRMAGLV